MTQITKQQNRYWLLSILLVAAVLFGTEVASMAAQAPGVTEAAANAGKTLQATLQLYEQEAQRLIDSLPEENSQGVRQARQATVEKLEKNLAAIQKLEQPGEDNSQDIIALLSAINSSTVELEQGVRVLAQQYGEAYQRSYGMGAAGNASAGNAVTVGEGILAQLKESMKQLQAEKQILVTGIIAIINEEQELSRSKGSSEISSKAAALLKQWAQSDPEAVQAYIASAGGGSGDGLAAGMLLKALQSQAAAVAGTAGGDGGTAGSQFGFNSELREGTMPSTLYSAASSAGAGGSGAASAGSASSSTASTGSAQAAVDQGVSSVGISYPTVPDITMDNGLPVDGSGAVRTFAAGTDSTQRGLASALGFGAATSYGDPYYIYGIGSVPQSSFAQRWNSNNGTNPSGSLTLDLTQPLGYYQYLSWGLWADKPMTSATVDGFYQGTWLAVAEDKVTNINSLPVSGSAAYNGKMVGQTASHMYNAYINNTANTANINWDVALTADFAKHTIAGDIKSSGNAVGTLNAAWQTAGNSANKLVGHIATTAAETVIGAATGVVVGGFFGPAGEEIGGIWSLVNKAGTQTATGILAAQVSTANQVTIPPAVTNPPIVRPPVIDPPPVVNPPVVDPPPVVNPPVVDPPPVVNPPVVDPPPVVNPPVVDPPPVVNPPVVDPPVVDPPVVDPPAAPEYPVLKTVTINDDNLPVIGNEIQTLITSVTETGQISAVSLGVLVPLHYENVYKVYGVGSASGMAFAQRYNMDSFADPLRIGMPAGNYAYLRWGYWNDNPFTTQKDNTEPGNGELPYSAAPQPGFYQGMWLAADQSAIMSAADLRYLPAGTAAYRGVMRGMTANHLYNNVSEPYANVNWYVNLAVNFDSYKINGRITNAQSTENYGSIDAAWNTSGNSAEKIIGKITITNGSDSSTVYARGVFAGGFFGPQGQEIGGIWNVAGSDSSQTATGILAARNMEDNAYFAERGQLEKAASLGYIAIPGNEYYTYGLASAPGLTYTTRLYYPVSGTVDGSFQYLQWGRWNDLSAPQDNDGFYQRNFIRTISNIERAHVASPDFPTAGTAVYDGYMIGSTAGGTALDWRVVMKADFANGLINGYLPDAAHGSVGTVSGSWANSGSKSGIISGTLTLNSTNYYNDFIGSSTGALVGGFYGSKGDEMGGIWSLESMSGVTATGVLVAEGYSGRSAAAAFTPVNLTENRVLYGVTSNPFEPAAGNPLAQARLEGRECVANDSGGTMSAMRVRTGGAGSADSLTNDFSYLSWGYWNNTTESYTDANYQQTWLEAQPGRSNVSAAPFPQSGTASYSGIMTGHMEGSYGASNINWTIGLNADFSSRKIIGSINTGNVQVSNALLAFWPAGSNDITGTLVKSFTANAGNTPVTFTGGVVKAAFYGPKGEEIGGAWRLRNSNGDSANGVLAAKKNTP